MGTEDLKLSLARWEHIYLSSQLCLWLNYTRLGGPAHRSRWPLTAPQFITLTPILDNEIEQEREGMNLVAYVTSTVLFYTHDLI